MTVALLVARLVLSLVFAVAALGKLADPAGARLAARELGASEQFAALAVRLLPLAELAVAIALLLTATAQPAALAALVLLGAFTVQVSRALLAGARPDCHCFGRLHASAASWRLVARDALLAATAGFVAISPGSTAHTFVPWVSGLSTGETIVVTVAVLEGLALMLGGALVAPLVRRYGNLLLRIDELEGHRPQRGLSLGSDAPGFSLQTLEGERRSLLDLTQRGATLLVFSDPTCAPCVAMLPDVVRWHTEPAPLMRPVLITSGDLASNRVTLMGHGLQTALWDERRGVAQAYGVQGTPSAVLVSQAGRIASQTALGAPAINRLVDEIRQVSRAVEAPPATRLEASTRRPGQVPTHLLTLPPTEAYR
jgi:peroxiredoxin